MADKKKALWITGSIAMLLVGIFVIPKLMHKLTGRIYRDGHDDIDFDNLGPEIVKKNSEENTDDGD